MKKRKETILICLVAGILLSTSLSMVGSKSNSIDESANPFSFYEHFFVFPLDVYLTELDLENDGDIDFVHANLNRIIACMNNGGTYEDFDIPIGELDFNNGQPDHVGFGGLASGDINNDDLMDIVTGGWMGKLRIFENNDGEFFSHLIWDFEQDLYSLDVIDWNNDGLNDIIAGYTDSYPSDSRVALVLNLGNGVFTDPIDIYQVETRMFSDLDADDFDNDGDCDVLIAYSELERDSSYFANGTIVLLRNDGADNFTSSVVSHRGDGQYHYHDTRIHPRLAVADYDQDGNSDFAFGDNSGIVELLWNNGDASFQESIVLCDMGYVSKITDADFDMDGDIDIVVSTRGYEVGDDPGFYVMYNNIVPMSLRSPQSNHLYLFNRQLRPDDSSLLIGPTTFRINRQVETDYVEFYANDKLMHTDSSYPFEWRWGKLHFGEANVEIIGYFADGTTYTLQEHYTKIF